MAVTISVTICLAGARMVLRTDGLPSSFYGTVFLCGKVAALSRVPKL